MKLRFFNLFSLNELLYNIIADDVPDNQSTIADGNSQDSTHAIAEITLVKRRYVGVENV